MEWIEIQDQLPPDDGTPILVCMPLADGDACYSAAYVNGDNELEDLCGGEITFTPTHWMRLTPPTP